MRPERFPESNTIFQAPRNTPEGLVSDVAAFTDGNNVITFWQPDARERMMIAAGQGIYVRLLCGGTPQPVSLHVESPFINEPDEERLEELEDGADACASCQHFSDRNESGVGFCGRWQHPVAYHYVCKEFQSKPQTKP